jgi:hypothetical protein
MRDGGTVSPMMGVMVMMAMPTIVVTIVAMMVVVEGKIMAATHYDE